MGKNNFQVYGLAPTGRAASQLAHAGISSQTLHRFLKEFKAGRNQISEKSVFVLDEAGMVGLRDFGDFLKAVHKREVKVVIVVGGGQL